jgi:hypothetical protein
VIPATPTELSGEPCVRERLPTMNSRSLHPFRAALLALTLLGIAGCESDPDRHAMEEARRSMPAMAAQDTFFDGKISAHLTLGSSLVEIASPGKGPDGSSGGRGAQGGGHMHGGGRGSGAGRGRGREGGSARPEGEGSANSDEPRPHLVNSPMPPARLHLWLENTSPVPLVVEIRGLNSELGDFATQPDTFTLEPGASAEPDAMQPLLGVDSLALPITLTLRAGGKVETRILTLRPIPPPPPAP